MQSVQQLTSEISILKTKLETQVKKNNNLLKMNSNLMKENQTYQNTINIIKKWSINFFKNEEFGKTERSNFSHYQNNDEQEQSAIIDPQDIEEYMNQIITEIENKFNLIIQNKYMLSKIHTDQTELLNFNDPSMRNQTFFMENLSEHKSTFQPQTTECTFCDRWKQLYMKQTKQNSRLESLLQNSSFFKTQKNVNLSKLKNDTQKLLQDYWNLYRKQYKILDNNPENVFIENNSTHSIIYNNSQRTIGEKQNSGHKKSKQKKSGSKQLKKNPFSKQKSSKPISNVSSKVKSDIISFNNYPNGDIISSLLQNYCENSKKLEEELNFVKQQLKQYVEILNIYRENQRDRILYKEK